MENLYTTVRKQRNAEGIEQIESSAFRHVHSQDKLDTLLDILSEIEMKSLLIEPDIHSIVFETVPKQAYWDTLVANINSVNRGKRTYERIRVHVNEGWDAAVVKGEPGDQVQLLVKLSDGRVGLPSSKTSYLLSRLAAASAPAHFRNGIGVLPFIEHCKLLRSSLSGNGRMLDNITHNESEPENDHDIDNDSLNSIDEEDESTRIRRRWISVKVPNLFGGEYRKEVTTTITSANGEPEQNSKEYGQNLLESLCVALGLQAKDTDLFFYLLPDKFHFHPSNSKTTK